MGETVFKMTHYFSLCVYCITSKIVCQGVQLDNLKNILNHVFIRISMDISYLLF